uniref:Uncharacterized protein n=1 Tax=Heliothis virescens TaxID=7102 RepID=A0A2A4JCU0_HELVI
MLGRFRRAAQKVARAPRDVTEEDADAAYDVSHYFCDEVADPWRQNDALERERLSQHAALRELVSRGDSGQLKARLSALGSRAGLIANLTPGGANTLLYVCYCYCVSIVHSTMEEQQEQTSLKALVRKRGAVKGSITKITAAIKNPGTLSKQALLLQEERLRAAFSKYEELNLEICALDPEDDDTAVEDTYMASLTTIKESLAKFEDSNSNVTEHSCYTKLPTINVPTFTEKRALALENAEQAGKPTSTPKTAHVATVKEAKGSGKVTNTAADTSASGVKSCLLCVPAF